MLKRYVLFSPFYPPRGCGGGTGRPNRRRRRRRPSDGRRGPADRATDGPTGTTPDLAGRAGMPAASSHDGPPGIITGSAGRSVELGRPAANS